MAKKQEFINYKTKLRPIKGKNKKQKKEDKKKQKKLKRKREQLWTI